jgi:hypothetical protein
MRSDGYIITKSCCLRLHRLIMDCPNDKEVDHIDHNPSNNRKINLRIVTSQQNKFNQNVKTNNTSGVKGVSWSKERRKWETYIGYNGKKINLGRFVNLKDAIQARKEAEIKYFGEYNLKEGDYYEK